MPHASLRSYVKPLAAAASLCALYPLARPSEPSSAERAGLAQRFRFERVELPVCDSVPARPRRSVRAVHPQLEHIAAWISSVGAAVAVGDLDGDGLSNDVVHVDTRNDALIVAPAPVGRDATAQLRRYAPFELRPECQPYDGATMAPMGALLADLDLDGQCDVLAYYWGRPPLAFLRRPGRADAAEGPRRELYAETRIVACDERWYTNAALLSDFDGDGRLDLALGNYFQDGARVLDVHAGEPARMQSSMSNAQNGGRNRLLLGRAGARAGGAASALLFEEEPAAFSKEDACGWTLALGAADLDGDLLPELYVANDFGPDRLLHNRSTPGHARFARLEGRRELGTPKSKVLGRDSFKGMGVDFGDLNGDGWPDIVVSNITQEYGLLESNLVFLSTGENALMQRGIAPYVERGEALGLARSGWGWDVRLADFDNDGTLELVQATGFVRGTTDRWSELQELATANDALLADPRSWPRIQPGDDLSGHGHVPFFARARSGRFVDLAPALSLGETGLGRGALLGELPLIARGIALADVDGDGCLDWLLANQWQPSCLLHNRGQDRHRFLGLHLLLPLASTAARASVVQPGHAPPLMQPARPAIGASARVRHPDGRVLVAQVDGGSGHSGKRAPELIFGLGVVPLASQLSVELRWRDPAGRVRSEQLELSPGWHSVLLAWPSPIEDQP